MRQRMRVALWLVLASVLGTLFTVTSTGVANAAESIPDLQWPAVDVGRRTSPMVESTTGSITVGCTTIDTGQDLVTYSAAGQLLRHLSRTEVIDGAPNCIETPIVDKNDVLYGIPSGKNAAGSWVTGPNLLAYAGNTLKWKYPLSCGYSTSPSFVVGANGNIYSTTYTSDGVHLIGIRPELENGQTQPAKVLDVKIPNDCSIMLSAYKDGIMLHGQSSSGAHFYSYGGKKLNSTTGSIWNERINAEGQLFYPSYVAGPNYSSLNVNMYDPRSGKVVWTKTASVPGADSNLENLAPLPGGGVVALIAEQEMDAYGIPVVPKTWAKKLVTLSSAGQILQTVTLPRTYGTDNTFGNTFINAEGGGKVVVIRELFLDTQISWPSAVPALVIGVYNAYSGDWGYQTVMQGDLNKAGGPTGYNFEYVHYAHTMAITNGALGFVAKCTNNCSNSNLRAKLYAVSVPGLGMTYPRGDVIAANIAPQPTPRSYVALGDSYSSGEGVPPFEDGTDSSTNACHRSKLAYSRVLSTDPWSAADLNLGGFWACSGAKTKHLTGKWAPTDRDDGKNTNELAQIDHLDANTKLVSLTIGGNDMGFTDFGTACVLAHCSEGTAAYNTAMNNVLTVVPNALMSTYVKLLDKATGAKIYVLDYPQVAPDKSSTDPYDPRCDFLYDGYWSDARAARDVVTALNNAIRDAVGAVRAMKPDYAVRLQYVPVNSPGSPFIGHTMCADPGDSYFNNLDTFIGHEAYVLHPNERGSRAYARILKAAMSQ